MSLLFYPPAPRAKFRKEMRTPAMQAGLVSRKLSFREVFTGRVCLSFFVSIWIALRWGIMYSVPCQTCICNSSLRNDPFLD